MNAGFASLTRIVLLTGALWGAVGLHPGAAVAQPDADTAAIDRFVQTGMHRNGIPGLSVAIVREDRIVYAKGFGKSGDGRPVTPDTPFAVASLSKSITALAVMQLAEAGKIGLDDPVQSYMPSFGTEDPRSSAITARQLLNQTSGLADSVFPEMTFRKQPAGLEEAIARLRDVKLADAPGTRFHYHNPNYQILARLVEIVSRERFPDYLRRHIFRPLRMEHTVDAANAGQFSAASAGFSDGHIFLYGMPVAQKEPDWFVEGAAGIVSTADDMAHWLMLQLGGGRYEGAQLLGGEGIKAMHTAPEGTGGSYGMGWTVDGSRIGHTGILWTYYAEQLLLPESGYGIVVLFNSGLNALVDYSSFARGIADILSGAEPEAPFLAGRSLELIIGLLTVFTVAAGLRGFFRVHAWERKYRARPVWASLPGLLAPLVPLALFLLLPQIVSFIAGGRELSWQRILLMMPSVFIWLMVASLLGAVNALKRVSAMWRIGKAARLLELNHELPRR